MRTRVFFAGLLLVFGLELAAGAELWAGGWDGVGADTAGGVAFGPADGVGEGTAADGDGLAGGVTTT